MNRRALLSGAGLLLAVLAAGGGALAALLKREPDTALYTDPEMREFAYSDGWIIPVRR